MKVGDDDLRPIHIVEHIVGQVRRASMVGKQCAIVSDMRLDHHTRLGSIAENLLRITGEDTVTFDRKDKGAWTGRLPVRFFILTNMPLNLPDAAGAKRRPLYAASV